MQASPFRDDPDRRSKLQVAIASLQHIIARMAPADRVAVSVFNDSPTTRFPLQNVTAEARKALTKLLSKEHADGGTRLAAGLQHGFELLRAEEENQLPQVRVRHDTIDCN